MPAKHDPQIEYATAPRSSNLPLVTLILVVALWYAWGVALVLLDVL
jgi:hypothetical protein